MIAGFLSAGRARGQDEAPPRPSILFYIADDWSFPHAGAYGDRVVKTPAFDRLAAEGALFTAAFCAAPSCTPSRAAILTGQAIHRLGEGGNLWGSLPARFVVYPEVLEVRGYAVGLLGKGWAPGSVRDSGRERNPAGHIQRSFREFLGSVPAGKPFCFWFGGADPHRPYDPGSGRRSGLKPGEAAVPPFLPDRPEVREDMLDYYFEVERFDRQVGQMLEELERSGRAKETLVVVTSDNGMPFPRAKANLYDSGTRVPLCIRWPGRVTAGRKVDAPVSLADLAPSFLAAAGIQPPEEMTGRSLLPLVTGAGPDGRDRVFIERERHANVRKGDLGYPARAIRTAEFLYIRNLEPDRWPAGDPEMHRAVGPFGDVDASPTKELVLSRRAEKEMAPFFRLAFEKRPAEELYDLARDPHQLENVAGRPAYEAARKKLRAALEDWMAGTGDPRARGEGSWDAYPYYGPPPKDQRQGQ